jgi:hypothetical protein
MFSTKLEPNTYLEDFLQKFLSSKVCLKFYLSKSKAYYVCCELLVFFKIEIISIEMKEFIE